MTDPTVAVVDNHQVLLDALGPALLNRGFEVVATVHSVEDLPRVRIDTVVCDLHLPHGPSGLEAIRGLVEPNRAVLAMSGVSTCEGVLDAIEVGASGYVDKTEAALAIADAAWGVQADGVHVSAHLAAFLLSDARRRPLPSDDLSSRERATLRHRAQGDTVDECARALRLSRAQVVDGLTRAVVRGRERRRILRPTPGELDVLERIACGGLSNLEVAAELAISPWTVTSRLKTIQDKWRRLHPERPTGRSPRQVARDWGIELDLCHGRKDPNSL